MDFSSPHAIVVDASHEEVLRLPHDASAVIVGTAGSGKTHVIQQRVAALIAQGLAPDEIVVLTPTRQAATALRDSLALAVRVATPGALARSVAAFAFQTVRAHAVHVGDDPPQLLTGPDEDRIVQDLLAGDAEDERDGMSRWPAWLAPEIRATAGFRTEVRAFLAECISLGISPDVLDSRAQEQEVWGALASFAHEYSAVRAAMRRAHRDAAGLIQEATALVRSLDAGSPARAAQARIRVILVDDTQELTLGGIELLLAWRERGAAVMAFGDPDIGSGAFRGASPEYFARLLSSMPLHILTTRHRGTPAHARLLADVTSRIGAAGIVAHRRAALATRDASPEADSAPTDSSAADTAAQESSSLDDSVQTYVVRSVAEEYDTIARLLRERRVHDGVPWSSCAVIAHDSRQVTALEAELAARDVPTRAAGPGRNLAQVAAVRDLLHLVDVAARDIDEWDANDPSEALRGGGLDTVELRRLRTALRHRELAGEGYRSASELLASGLAYPLEFELLDTREGRKAARVGSTLALLRDGLATGASAHELLWTAWQASGRERVWTELAQGHGALAGQARRDLDAVVALFQTAKRHGERADGTSPLDFLRSLRDAAVAVDRFDTGSESGVVRVLTPASALGTEFDTVVIAGIQDGIWPNLRARGSLLETWRLAHDSDTVDRRRGVLHDELRLFARALSRAHARLIFTAVDDDDTGPSMLFELLPTPQPAPQRAAHPLTLRGLVAAHRRTLTTAAGGTGQPSDADVRHAAGQLALLAEAGVSGADPLHWYGIAPATSDGVLRDLDAEDVRISPSRLAALEQCELDWVIGDLGGDGSSTSAGLGTIIHEALELVGTPDRAALWEVVERRWKELDFAAPWVERKERALAEDLVMRLVTYLRDVERAGTRLIGAEPRFEVRIPQEGRAHDALLSGIIDRVEVTADGSVVIVDLKTGKSEKTSAAAIAENAQLASYQLAFERGAIQGLESTNAEATSLRNGGAKLLVLRTGSKKIYLEPLQAPFTDDTRSAFLARVDRAVEVMTGRRFTAPFEEHCRKDHSYGLCTIHTIGPVSAS